MQIRLRVRTVNMAKLCNCELRLGRGVRALLLWPFCAITFETFCGCSVNGYADV